MVVVVVVVLVFLVVVVPGQARQVELDTSKTIAQVIKNE